MLKMKTPLLLLVLMVLVGATASPTRAQFPSCTAVTGQFDGSTLALDIRIFGSMCQGAAVALDVYRTTLGLEECGPTTRINELPIPYPGGPYPESTSLLDADVAPGMLYRYEVRPVDAERNPAAGSLAVDGVATTGVALLSHSTVYLDRFGGLTGYWTGSGCPQECLTGGHLSQPLPDGLLPHVDGETHLLLYGEIVGVALAYNYWNPVLRIDQWRPALCIIGVTPTPWSSLKQLYR